MKKKPFIATRDLIIFPGIITPIFIGRKDSVDSLERAMVEDSKVVLCMQKDFSKEEPELPEDIYDIGVEANILQTMKMPNNTIKVLIEAQKRIVLKNVEKDDQSYIAEYETLESNDIEESEREALYRKAFNGFEEYARVSTKVVPDVLISIKEVDDLERALDLMASNLPIQADEKQELLSTLNISERGIKIIEIIKRETELVEIEKKIDGKVKDKINQAQKAYYIKEKINFLKEEIAEEDEDNEIQELKKKVAKAKLPKYAKEKMAKEIKRLEKMPGFSSEATVARTYIETVTDLPWNKKSKDKLDIKKVSKKLDEDHYGLEKVKERILEYLSVKKLNPKMKGLTLCLVGPPGVGKTSLAKSIAEAMGRSFTRVSLGGVRDESEIRGHRRTYVGSMPGRIIKGFKEAQTKNPLILLDEIDKMSSDFKGDPSSAMLEVLDPGQNSHFEDHYLDMHFDISEGFFIATANDLRNIPGPLRDRMEIIPISSYTEYEKMHIAKNYLIKEGIVENGLTKVDISISDNAILKVIDEYTREAGVRTLKREINGLFRKVAMEVVTKDKKSFKVSASNLSKYAGKVKYRPEKMREKKSKMGVVNGLAWTAVGGVSLEVQGILTPGKGGLVLTGTLGNVMKESAQVANTFVKANLEKFGITDENIYKEKDIHLHFPEGATPKDGPSAGITITTTIISILSGKEVRQDIAMTGEVTIRGEVLPVGGIKEKVLGAHRVGIREVILPIDNKNDVDEIPVEVRKDMKFHFATEYGEVEKIVFEKSKKTPKKKTAPKKAASKKEEVEVKEVKKKVTKKKPVSKKK